jgi:hypothetical protein
VEGGLRAHHAGLPDGVALTAIDLAQTLKRILDAQAVMGIALLTDARAGRSRRAVGVSSV